METIREVRDSGHVLVDSDLEHALKAFKKSVERSGVARVLRMRAEGVSVRGRRALKRRRALTRARSRAARAAAREAWSVDWKRPQVAAA
jgi:ribosomal protein S21